MSWDELYPLVSQWVATGSLAESDKPLILQAYTEVTGLTFSGSCKKCQWSDVQHALQFHLIKSLKYPAMNTNKWMIATTIGYLAVHGLAHVYVNKGTVAESESAKHLTDPIAEALLEKFPDLSEVIVENPDYGKKAESTESKEPTKKSAPTDDKLTPQQKAAKTKADNKVKADAEAAEKAKLDAELTVADERAKQEAANTGNTQTDQGTGTNA